MKNPIAFLLGLLVITGAAANPAMPGTARPEPPVLLLGEQHDAPEHRRLQRETVQALAGRGALAALALEMAESGSSTVGLSPQAGEDEVRQALRWKEEVWPWADYAPPIMAAVSAGVPVFGANLPRERMRAAMADVALDVLLPGPVLTAQQQAIRLGHCGLLPESQVGPMTRIQIARDRAMAQTVEQLRQDGKTVVLIAGAAHVNPELGVPQHLAPGLESRTVVLPPQPPPRDYCEDLRRRFAPQPAS